MASDASNPAFDPHACREHLGALLTEETAALRDLEELLLREYDVLGAKNVAAIERTALVRAQMMGGLARIEEQRRSLCTSHGYTADWVGLESLMQWCDRDGTLLHLLRECAKRATNCRDMNNRNGTLVQARLKQVEGLLAALTPAAAGAAAAAQPVTYGPKGSPGPAGRRSRELGAA
jgi:flagellar biosynthesis/type III secretory pathway chaperone